jgi:hypothetical protein
MSRPNRNSPFDLDEGNAAAVDAGGLADVERPDERGVHDRSLPDPRGPLVAQDRDAE